MTDTALSLQHSWKHLSKGAGLGGSGIFGFADTQKTNGARRGNSAQTGASDRSGAFNNLFTNNLQKSALSGTDPRDAAEASTSQSPAAVARSQSLALSSPLAPAMLSTLLGLNTRADVAGGSADPSPAANAVDRS